MPTKTFMLLVAKRMNKPPEKVASFTEQLEDDWVENVGAMRQIDDEQWATFGLPIGLLNIVKEMLIPPPEPDPVEPEDQLAEGYREVFQMLMAEYNKKPDEVKAKTA